MFLRYALTPDTLVRGPTTWRGRTRTGRGQANHVARCCIDTVLRYTDVVMPD